MNIKSIANKIVYHNLNNLGVFDLTKIAFDNDLFSDIEFLEYFKNKDKTFWFWTNAIVLTKISIKEISIKYKDYIFKDSINLALKEMMTEYLLYDQFSDNKSTLHAISNIKEYFNEFKNYQNEYEIISE